MKIEKLDRIAVAVRDTDKAAEFFSDLLGIEFDEPIIDGRVNMRVRYSAHGLELIEPTTPDSPVAKFIEERGGGLCALVFKVADIEKAKAEMNEKGVRDLGGAWGNVEIGRLKEAVFNPRDSYGVMLVLAEYPQKHPGTVAALEFEPKPKDKP